MSEIIFHKVSHIFLLLELLTVQNGFLQRFNIDDMAYISNKRHYAMYDPNGS